MGRPIGFDKERALNKATQLFWKQGYTKTSVAELQRTMKLGESSFYNSFRSKKALYLECLKHYNKVNMLERSRALRSDRSAKERIYDFFDVVLSELEENSCPGCFTTNSLSHEVLREKELKGFLFSNMEAFLAYLQTVIEQGQKEEEISANLPPEVTARVVFTYLQGLHRLAVYQFNRKQRRKETRAFLDSVL